MFGVVMAILLPTVLGYGALAAVRVRRAWSDRDPAGGPVPLGPPIERVAADLRRINRQRHDLRRDSRAHGRALRFRALDAAYHDVLLIACRAVEVVPPAVTAGGVALPADIHRVEIELQQHGLDVGPHRRNHPGVDADEARGGH
jgi:hypothetical protein